jgi:4-amino-4-deoxy-L-arabinose transferase-like glycosyltransferase
LPSLAAERRVDSLSLFGLFSVTAMLVCYAREERHHLYVLGFAAACGLASLYGFLQGAWPFGLVELVFAGVALERWRKRRAAE